MKLRVGLAALMLLVAMVSVSHAKIAEVAAPDVKQMMDAGDAVVINPLSAIEFRELAIEGSVNIPSHKLATDLPADKATKLIFYCLGPK